MTERATLTEATATASPAGTTGKMLVQLITPGKGSSGVYSAAVLEQAARDRVWPAGTHMYADHPSRSEDANRPERSVRDIAGILLEDARWDADAQALVAEAQPVGPLGAAMVALKDAIGVSIRASAEVEEGQHDGKRARIVTKLIEGQSVDFVTRAGRGGRVLQLLESATEAIEADLTEVVSEAGAATPIVPVIPAAESTTVPGGHMSNIEEGLKAQLDEATGRVTAAEARAEAAERSLAEHVARDSARPIVNAALAEAKLLDADDRAAIADRLVGSATLTDAGQLDEAALKVSTDALIALEESRVARYLTAHGVGGVRGFGDTAPPSSETTVSAAESAVASAFGHATKIGA